MAGDKLKMSAIVIQCASALSIAYLTTLSGLVCAWPSYTIGIFRSNHTVLSSQMTTWHVSLLGSMNHVGALLMTPMCGYIVDKLGRKYSAMLFGLPYVITWSILSMTTSVPLVISAIGIVGFGTAGQSVSSVYIGEICHESIRGALTSTVASMFSIGVLFSYTIGGYLTYYQIIYTHLSLSVLYILLLMLLKESPVFLMKIGKEKEAAKSIAFYRHVEVTSKEIEIEIAKIKLQLNPKIGQIQEADKEELTASDALLKTPSPIQAKPDSAWSFLKKSKSSRRALIVVVTLMSLTILMGSTSVQVYAELLFQEAVPTMSANMCSIFLAIDYLIATLISASLLDKFGRKFLLTSTSVASGVFCLLLGTQLQLRWAPHWFTAFLIYGYSFGFNLGPAVVPFVLNAEVFLPEIRGFGSSTSMAFLWIMNFVTLFIFNPLASFIGLGPLFYGFSVICFITAIYSKCCLPETMGLTVDAIQLAFLKKKIERNVKA